MKFSKPREVQDEKTSIFREYIVPVGSLLIPAITLWGQSSPPLWVSLVIVVYFVIAAIFVVFPSIALGVRRLRSHLSQRRLEKIYLPKISESLRRLKPMMESNRSDTIWGGWEGLAKSSNMQKFIRPGYSHFYTLKSWLDHLDAAANSAKPSNLKMLASEASAWTQQYVSFCRDAFGQFEEMLRSKELDDAKVREVRQSWNHARDEHNQVINAMKALCSEINLAFGEKICWDYFETLKTLE